MSGTALPTRSGAADIVLLHGWGMTPAAWAPVQSLLGGRRSSARALALPGHAGAAPAPAAEVAAWSGRLASQLPPATTVVGWSLGALLALDLARRCPERVARLVLIGGTARFVADDASAPSAWPGLAPATVDAFRAGFTRDPHATLKRFLALQCLGEADRRGVQTLLGAALTPLDAPEQRKGDEGDASPPAFPTSAATPTNPARAALADGLTLLARTDLRATLPRIEQPCLLIHGEHDALMPIAAARAMALALPCAQLEILRGSGHALPLSRSADCARLIVGFADA
jgi:pimeloyl-[acyl-carrier protein] methyl ester esterase